MVLKYHPDKKSTGETTDEDRAKLDAHFNCIKKGMDLYLDVCVCVCVCMCVCMCVSMCLYLLFVCVYIYIYINCVSVYSFLSS